jgi:hypothetical protein
MEFPASWSDPRYLVAVAGVVAVGVLAVVLNLAGEFSTELFGAGVLGVVVIGAAGVAASSRLA